MDARWPLGGGWIAAGVIFRNGLGGPKMRTNLQRKLDDWLLTVDARTLRAWTFRVAVIGTTSGMLGILIASRL